MLFDLQLLGKPDAAGNADVIENRTLAAASVEEAVRTAKDIVLNTPVPGIYGFRLMRNGLEVFHWFIGQDDAWRPYSWRPGTPRPHDRHRRHRQEPDRGVTLRIDTGGKPLRRNIRSPHRIPTIPPERIIG